MRHRRPAIGARLGLHRYRRGRRPRRHSRSAPPA